VTDLELGQMILSNNRWHSVDMEPHVEAGIELIAAFHAEASGREQAGQGPLTGNSGGSFSSPLFDMRAYCWCDGEGEHRDGCPPNFHHHASGFRATWYKYNGRGGTQSRRISAREWSRIVVDCLTYIGTADPADLADDYDKQAQS
jgi:hypothetical protein